MDCIEFKSILIERYDKKLSEELIVKMDQHVEKCTSCQEEFIQTGNILDLLSSVKDEKPSPNLKTNFYTMLANEANQEKKLNTPIVRKVYLKKWLHYAAVGIIVLTIGFIAGLTTGKDSVTNHEIAVLKSEIEVLKQNSYILSLNHPSSSERLQIIHQISDKQIDNTELIYVLIQTLNNDKNVNVRIASAYALAKHAYNEEVRSAIIHSLKEQTEPILQITLINILINIQDERAKPLMKDFLEREDVLPEVKEYANIGIKALI